MKRLFALLLTLALLLGSIPCVFADQLEGGGFVSPEVAMEAYVQFLDKGSLDGMLSCFAIETYVDNLSPEEFASQYKTVTPILFEAVPAANSYTRQLLKSRRYGKLSQFLFSQYLTYTFAGTAYDALGEGLVIPLKEQEDVDDFLETAQAASMGNWVGKVKLIGCCNAEEIFPHEGKSLEAQKRYYERIVARTGCDESQEVVATISIDGRQYYQFMNCGKYGEKWYLLDFFGFECSYQGLNALQAGLIPCSKLDG